MWSIIVSKIGAIVASWSAGSSDNEEVPLIAEAYTTGKSSWSSSAPSSMKSSKTSSTTSAGRADGLSILLTTTIGTRFCSKAFFNTKRVCGMVPS